MGKWLEQRLVGTRVYSELGKIGVAAEENGLSGVSIEPTIGLVSELERLGIGILVLGEHVCGIGVRAQAVHSNPDGNVGRV